MTIKQKEKTTLTEIRFHGRGGQGAKTAAQVLGEAALHDEKYFQAFPQYGPERRGAAVTTYTRISNQPIDVKSQIQSPNYSVILDSTLLNSTAVTQGLQESGTLIINTTKELEEIRKLTEFTGSLITINASEIARFFIEQDIPNLVMLGALNKVGAFVDFEDLAAVVEKNFKNKWGEEITKKNILAMKTGSEEVLH